MPIEIYNKTKGRIDKKFLTSLAREVLSKMNYDFEKVNLTLIFLEDREMKALNKKYRGINRSTDVLTFKFSVSPQKFILPKQIKPFLGEIIISYPKARQQAKLFGHSQKKEIARLFVHGLLHLLGFEHKTKFGKSRMVLWENKILKMMSFALK